MTRLDAGEFWLNPFFLFRLYVRPSPFSQIFANSLLCAVFVCERFDLADSTPSLLEEAISSLPFHVFFLYQDLLLPF